MQCSMLYVFPYLLRTWGLESCDLIWNFPVLGYKSRILQFGECPFGKEFDVSELLSSTLYTGLIFDAAGSLELSCNVGFCWACEPSGMQYRPRLCPLLNWASCIWHLGWERFEPSLYYFSLSPSFVKDLLDSQHFGALCCLTCSSRL